MSDADVGPILNGPYEAPERYFEMGPSGIRAGRRPSESLIPIAVSKKGKKVDDGFQAALDVELTSERRERNNLINDIRRDVEKWRLYNYEHVTPTSRKLLQHWSDPARENRVLFCQRDAVETAIFLHEVAGRHGYPDWRQRLEEPNAEHNSGLPRVALKMATGSGKTVVMAMLIAWQTANKAASPRDVRFANKFLIVTPGITIRDRLQVLRPSVAGNYYDERELIPPDMLGCVQSRLGHATAAETLDTYSHLWPDSDDRTRQAIDEVLGEATPTVEEAPATSASADQVRTNEAPIGPNTALTCGGADGGDEPACKPGTSDAQPRPADLRRECLYHKGFCVGTRRWSVADHGPPPRTLLTRPRCPLQERTAGQSRRQSASRPPRVPSRRHHRAT